MAEKIRKEMTAVKQPSAVPETRHIYNYSNLSLKHPPTTSSLINHHHRIDSTPDSTKFFYEVTNMLVEDDNQSMIAKRQSFQ